MDASSQCTSKLGGEPEVMCRPTMAGRGERVCDKVKLTLSAVRSGGVDAQRTKTAEGCTWTARDLRWQMRRWGQSDHKDWEKWTKRWHSPFPALNWDEFDHIRRVWTSGNEGFTCHRYGDHYSNRWANSKCFKVRLHLKQTSEDTVRRSSPSEAYPISTCRHVL